MIRTGTLSDLTEPRAARSRAASRACFSAASVSRRACSAMYSCWRSEEREGMTREMLGVGVGVGELGLG
jgi:hypothetical protein